MDFTLVGYSLLFIYLTYKIFDFLLRLPSINDLDSRYILVTGCDTGFGNAVAKQLDAMGCHVFATCLTETGQNQLRNSCSNRLQTILMDVSNHKSVQMAYKHVILALPHDKGKVVTSTV